MGIFRSAVRGTAKTFLDVPSWLGWQNLKSQTQFLARGVKPFFSIPHVTTTSPMDFERVMRESGISEEELKAKKKSYLFNAFLYSLAGLGCLLYSLYLFWGKHLFPGILAFLLGVLFFVSAFSMHFFYFEIKQRKLGCTFREWLSGHVGEK